MNKKILEGNRKAWNTAFKYHQKARGDVLHRKFADPNFSTFNRETDKALLEKIKKLKLSGKMVAHMQTNNGRELLSLMRVCGAKKGVGFDISNDAISEARELAAIANVDASFECVNILEISEKYNNFFDMIFITEGSLSWISDVCEYFSVMSRLLKIGGKILVSEIHPVGFLIDPDQPVDYDNKGPYKLLSSLDYVGCVDYVPQNCFWFMHKTSDIFMALIKNGFLIQEFEESTFDTGWIDPNNKCKNFPRSYVLLAEKIK